MALVDIRVELPAFSQTINVQVSDSSTILDLKREICRICVGGPRVEGQRIIWRGRPLQDTEKVQELWQSPNEPRIVHLAVHPSAWSSNPPDISKTPTFTPSISPPLPQPTPTRTSIFAATNPLAYVSARHQQALNALEQSTVSHLDPTMLVTRTSAVRAVEGHGWSWPSILDEEFPPASEGGVKYERAVIEGQTYLRLVESGQQPTAIQLHALNVLSHTFPILSLPSRSSSHTRTTASQPLPDINAVLQQLGLPAGRNAANANLAPNVNPVAAVQPPEIPLRPLLLPLFLLLLRTAILLYFFAPARKPVFGILIVMWMLYEVWRPIRDGILRGWNRAAVENVNRNLPPQQQPERDAARQAANAQANAVVADRRQAPVAQRPGPGAVVANDIDQQMAAAFDGLANLNVDAEAEILRRGAPAEEPGVWHKTVTFVTLLLTTVHPAVWNRRRAVLRQREGQIRMDANARAAQLDENVDDPQSQERIRRRDQLIAQHRERPQWIRNYMERVEEPHAWVDEAD